MMPDKRLIDANELEDRAYEIYVHASPEFKTRMNTLKELIDKAPTIDAEPVVHAHWKVRRGIPFCSNCLEIINGYSCDHDISTTPRCSFCGAKMDGGADK